MPRFADKKADTGYPITIEKDRYVEGDVDATMEGSVTLGEKPGNVTFPIQLDANGYLKMNLVAGGYSQHEYQDGTVNTGAYGTLMLGDDGANMQTVLVDAGGRLQVEVVEGQYDGVQYQDGAAVGSPFGYVMMGHDGANVFPVVVDSSGYLQVVDKKASVLNSTADVTLAATSTTQILPTLTSRLCALISNKKSNTQTFRIGDASTGATRGVELSPGQGISIESTEAIYGYNPGGAGEDVGVIWTQD
jgi:hypothetical protein